jgi:hypothetical protein
MVAIPENEGLEMDAVLFAGLTLAVLVTFDLLALRFGVSSRDGRKEAWW